MCEAVKGYVNELFITLNQTVANIVKTSPSPAVAIRRITETVSGEIEAASMGYMADIYQELSQETKQEAIFQDAANANKFYALNMRQRINDACRFDIQNLKVYSAGVQFKEINRTYASAGAAVGSAAVGGILFGILSSVTELPVMAAVIGAALVGVGGGAVTYYKVVPERDKANLLAAVHSFMQELEQELYRWVDGVVVFYHTQVEELKATLR